MSKILDLKKKKSSNIKIIMTVVISVVITTVSIKAGDNFLGQKEGGFNADEPCSSEMVFVPSPLGGFCIDKYEASAGEKCSYIEPANQIETRTNLDSPECNPDSKEGKIPWRFISQNQAARACAKVGKRLATNKEWLAAALGTPDSLGSWTENDCHVASNWMEQPGSTGYGKVCVSSSGAFDMIGNVWEWVAGTVKEGQFEGSDLPMDGYVIGVDDHAIPVKTNKLHGDENYYNDYFWLKTKGTRALARGGYWNNKEEAGQYALYAVSEPTFAGTGIGFRCVR